MTKLQRNAPCPCGSGIKYKHCCRLTQDPLEASYEPPPGSAITFVFDWYEIHDRGALIRLLERQPDIVGCEKQGWSRIDPGRPHLEPSALLEIVPDDTRLEVTTATESAAETTRWWLERIAGEFVTYEVGGAWEEPDQVGAVQGRPSVGAERCETLTAGSPSPAPPAMKRRLIASLAREACRQKAKTAARSVDESSR